MEFWGPGEFKLLEQSVGMNYEPDGLFFHVGLRRYLLPITHFRLDILHVLIVNGTMGFEIIEFLRALKRVEDK